MNSEEIEEMVTALAVPVETGAMKRQSRSLEDAAR